MEAPPQSSEQQMTPTPMRPPQMAMAQPVTTEDPTGGTGYRKIVRYVAYFDFLLAILGEIVCFWELLTDIEALYALRHHTDDDELSSLIGTIYAIAISCVIGIVSYPIGVYTSWLLLKSTKNMPPTEAIRKAGFWLYFNIFLLILAMIQILIPISNGLLPNQHVAVFVYIQFVFVIRLPLFYIVFRFIQELSRLCGGEMTGAQQITNPPISKDLKGEQQPYQSQ